MLAPLHPNVNFLTPFLTASSALFHPQHFSHLIYCVFISFYVSFNYIQQEGMDYFVLFTGVFPAPKTLPIVDAQ